MAAPVKKEFQEELLKKISIDGHEFNFYDVTLLGPDYEKLPYCLRILVECLVRRGHRAGKTECSAEVWKDSIAKLLDFQAHEGADVLFQPGRVLLQDFTGVPALVDLAALRDIIVEKGGDPEAIDSLCPADLVVDHTVQLDYSQIAGSSKGKSKKKQQEQNKKEAVPPHPNEAANMIQHPPPTVMLHPTFAPPVVDTPYYTYQPGFGTYQPVYASMPHPPQQSAMGGYYAVPEVPTFYPVNQPPAPLQAQVRVPNEGATSTMPTDNPGLPIQEEICPFHHRMSYWADLLHKNQDQEFQRNAERFGFLKWVNGAFKNITVIPPGTGVMHQVNLEYLARIVTCQDGLLFPDSLVGTDGHTTMINGLGVLGWCVGTMDAESVMFGHPISFPVPRVVGVKIVGQIPDFATSTEIVLLITKRLRHAGVSGSFVEFFGPGVAELSVADRATISNMCPEYGALIGFFPADDDTVKYLEHTGRDRQKVECIKAYLNSVKMLRNPEDPEPEYSSVVEVNLRDVRPCLSGPKRSKDKVAIEEVASQFHTALTLAEDDVQSFGLQPEEMHNSFTVNIDGSLHTVTHGSVLLAAITSCSNTSNPSVMLGAGLLAKKAIEAGLSVAKYVKTSLAPGSGIITSYLHESGVMPYLYMLGFEVVGYGCSSCVDNHKPLPQELVNAMNQGNLVCCGLLSGNRNFEGRIQSEIKANYLASPMLVIGYAIAGTVNIDFAKEPIGYNSQEKPIYLSDIWPSRKEIQEVENRFVIPAIFRQVFARVSYGNKQWASMQSPDTLSYPWNGTSTFIQSPSYIREIYDELTSQKKLEDFFTGMRCLLKLGDDVSSDHISPAGSIVRNSPAADYLASLGLAPRDYNSYGSRRGNCQVMMRGTFAHIRLQNQLSEKTGPHTTHFPSEVPTTIFEAAQRYKKEEVHLFIIAGENFGRGAPRDWATKGPLLLGIRAILAISFDPTYRANLIKTGILPVEIDRTTYDILTGREVVDIALPNLKAVRRQKEIQASLVLNGDFDLSVNLRLDNSYEVDLFREGGMIKQLLRKETRDCESYKCDV
jgi:aconitate hydratase